MAWRRASAYEYSKGSGKCPPYCPVSSELLTTIYGLLIATLCSRRTQRGLSGVDETAVSKRGHERLLQQTLEEKYVASDLVFSGCRLTLATRRSVAPTRDVRTSNTRAELVSTSHTALVTAPVPPSVFFVELLSIASLLPAPPVVPPEYRPCTLSPPITQDTDIQYTYVSRSIDIHYPLRTIYLSTIPPQHVP